MRSWLYALAGLLVCASCSGRNGDTITSARSFEAQDRSFSLKFSDPPWRVVKSSDSLLRLQVDSELFGFDLGENVPPMHILVASPVRLDEHLTDIIDPEDLHEILEQAGVDPSQIPSKIPESLATFNLSDLDSLNTSSWTGNLTGELTGEFTGELTGSQEPPQEAQGAQQAPRVYSIPRPAHPQDRQPKIPEYLNGVDIKNPRDVAVAEINLLVREKEALVVDGMQYLETEQGLRGVSYQLTMPPGVFVRNLYLPANGFVLRVGVLSLFELTTADMERLFASVQTNYELPLDEDARQGR